MASRITILDESTNLSVALVLDVVEQETYSGQATVTRHPVERGVSVADHVRPEPRPLEWVGSVSELPLEGTGLETDRLTRTLEVLESLRVSPHLYTVTTPQAIRASTHLTSYSARHSSTAPGVLEVTLRFEEIPVVEARRVQVKQPKRAPDSTKPKADAGRQVATSASPEARRKSIAARLTDGDFNVFGGE